LDLSTSRVAIASSSRLASNRPRCLPFAYPHRRRDPTPDATFPSLPFPFKMGNNPSNPSKPGTPASSSATSSHQQHDSYRHSKRESKSFPINTTHKVAAPPEQSLAQAQGSTISRPKSLTSSIAGGPTLTGSSPSSSSNSSAVVPPKLAESRHIPRDEPSKPVDVPLSHTESSSLRSQYGAHVVEAPLVSHSSLTDMSYLTRPPRLPLPIEEEVHTPGSPILAPAEIADVLEQDVEALDSDGMTRKSSALSSTSLDEEDADELYVDKNLPSVPTRIEWIHGGEKVYVTGTIFQWNKKQRLQPV
jgi:hypothetical protein